ncbi:phosphopantetheine-binding protein [Aquimarina algicola]|uniref:Acyl carrier protein n=1 Tax=Aquimarina algicola TaxID=2589995 RepID=A0A504JNC9_9FLAO|nr:phosphopantetheine-binding protein [Aquimarina algicola]TPN89318.1 acyl carrier protein [Aquimarina algicola]
MDSKIIFSLILDNLKEILSEIKVEDVNYDSKLCLLGANSIDRAELIEKTIEDLGIEADRFEFHSASNIGELTDLFSQKCNDLQFNLGV